MCSSRSSGSAVPICDLDLFGRAIADHHVVLLAHVVGDRLVEAVAADAHGARDDDAAERDDGDLARAAADVDDQVARRPGDGHVGADRRRQRLFDQIRLAWRRP